MTEEELREALRAHGFSSLNEFLDLRDKVCATSSEIKHKLLREEFEEFENEEVHLCGTCEWQYSSVMCPRAKDIMSRATDTCFDEAIACEKWKAKKGGNR